MLRAHSPGASEGNGRNFLSKSGSCTGSRAQLQAGGSARDTNCYGVAAGQRNERLRTVWELDVIISQSNPKHVLSSRAIFEKGFQRTLPGGRTAISLGPKELCQKRLTAILRSKFSSLEVRESETSLLDFEQLSASSRERFITY